tara:strand:+ start:367 stop:1464 length:1098 start_codon:yes stop_codon:yes gene_type:complete
MTTINIPIKTIKEFFGVEDISNVEDFLQTKSNSKLKEFCKDQGLKKFSTKKKPEMITFILSFISEPLSEEIVDSDDDLTEGEEEGEEGEETEDWEISTLHTNKEELTEFISENKIAVILLCSDDCEPCKKLKPKFIEYCKVNDLIEGAILNVDLYESNIGEIEPEVEYLPTVKICKDGNVAKVLEAPTIKKLEKEVSKIVNAKPSLTEMKEELKKRGLSPVGKKDELYQRIMDDERNGDKYHEKSREQLISILTKLKVRSKKHEDMDEIALIKKIRKEVQKKSLQNELRYEHLTNRFTDKEVDGQLKEMSKMTVKQLRVLADHGFATSSETPSFEYKKKEGENGEMVKALTKMQMIEKFRELLEN